MSMDAKIRKFTAYLLCGGILALSLGLLASPKLEFSENENRYLNKMPRLTAKTVLNGEYMESLEGFLADHFPMRDLFIGWKTKVELASGRRELGGVYIAEDGCLIESYKKPQNTGRIIDTLVRFYEKVKGKGADVRLMLVPTAVTVYQDKLPAFAPQSFQRKTAEEIYEATGIPAVDCTAKLLEAANGNEQLYYRTDHHWTMDGAYRGYLAYCEEKGIVPVKKEELEERVATDEFAGTLYSKVNDYSCEKDEIVLYENKADDLSVTYEDTGETADGLYNLDYLDKKDKYSLFLNNIHPFIEIENRAAESEDVLVLIKDSYANSMVPFLAHHYRKIYVFDTRYYKGGPSAFLDAHGEVTDVLLLYNMNTLDQDSGIRGIY